MKPLRPWAILCLMATLPVSCANAAAADKDDPIQKAQTVLASVPAAELPAKAAELIAAANAQDREAIALAAIRYTAAARSGSITPVVASVSRVLPESASAVAATAAKLAPSQASNISRVALDAAPGQSERITRALATDAPVAVTGNTSANRNGNANNGNGNGNGNANDNGYVNGEVNGNRPDVPPGWAVSKPGTIRGNRPSIPPGHVRNPKPGRDPQRRNYGSP